MALSLLLGLTMAVAVSVSIPIYADAVSYRVLNDRLYGSGANEQGTRRLPPFSFLFRYVGSWHGFLEWEETRQIDEYLSGQAAAMLGLPQKGLVRHFKTDRMRLFADKNAIYDTKYTPLGYVALGFISDLESHIEVLDGAFPQPVTNNTDPVQVLIAEAMVAELGMGVGEEYIVYYEEPPTSEGAVVTVFQHPIRIAGVWRALDPDEEYWFYNQSAFDQVFLMPEASYVQMAQGMRGEVGLALWSEILDGENIRSSDVSGMLTRIAVLRNKATALLTDLELFRSPEDNLRAYSRTVLLLLVSLYVFSVPVMAIVIYFISLISGMVVQRQRNEVAVLRSRGATTGQVVGIYVFEGLLIGALALVLGLLLGERLAQVMGLTRSFLILNARGLGEVLRVENALPTMFAWSSMQYGLIALVVSLLASVVPAMSASRDTIVTYRQETARSMRAPFWQRAFLDMLLLIPAGYGYYLLRQRGTISILEGVRGTADSPFSNPFLFIVPMLGVFALSLLCIRIFPLLMRLLAWLAGAMRGAVAILALRHLARTARHYVGPMLLLILTLSLAVFTASMAQTLDDSIVDRAYYDVGSDVRLVELGESTQVGGLGSPGGGPSSTDEEDEGPAWLFLPVSEHEAVEGVERAARVWSREVKIRTGTGSFNGVLVGVDRVDFSEVAFFRDDFAPASLGALMNALAVRDDAILVSREAMVENRLEVGDRIEMTIPVGSMPKVSFAVGGVVDYFPGQYPEEMPFFIGNLNFIFDNVGGIYPYDVWLDTETTSRTGAIVEDAQDLGLVIVRTFDAQEQIDKEQLKPERQGAFGLLSVGFGAAALLTVLGFTIYSFISFKRRSIELGVLRAVGLSVSQMAFFLIAEQLTLIATGALAGTGLGVLVSNLFIEFFQVQSVKHPFTPPFVVQIAWQEIAYIYAVFGAMFVAAVIALLTSLHQMRIFEAIKLGETT
jgi:putative ABC transport system permease protein